MSSQPLRIFHATTRSAVTNILEHGFDAGYFADLLDEVAQAHGTSVQAILAESRAYASYLEVERREERVSFTTNGGAACYIWAQQAPEATRMALWSVWRMRNPERAGSWTTDVEGSVWVKAHLACDSPVVFEVPVDYSELLEWGATDGGHRVASTLTEYGLLADPYLSHPEVSMPTGLFIPETELIVHDIARLIEWDEVAYLLGYEDAEFIALAKAGQFGPHATMPDALVSKPRARASWTLEDVAALRSSREPDQIGVVECECDALHPAFTTVGADLSATDEAEVPGDEPATEAAS